MNVKPLNYEWQDFYRQSADVSRHALSGARVWRRFAANRGLIPRLMNLARGTFSLKRVDFHTRIHGLLDSDPQMRPFFEGTSDKLPEFYLARMRGALGPLWDALLPGAIAHDQNAYRKDPASYNVVTKAVRATASRALVA
jgi:hypothetical protein